MSNNTEAIRTFLEAHYRDELARIAQSDAKTLEIDHSTLRAFDPDLAEDFLAHPEKTLKYTRRAIGLVDLPMAGRVQGITPSLYNLPDSQVIAPGEIRQQHGGRYVGVKGILERVTSTTTVPNTIEWRCQRCDNTIRIAQDLSNDDVIEPHECPSCERQGPFKKSEQLSDWSDYAKIRLKASPNASPSEEGKVVGYVLDDVIWMGGENGILGRAGEPVTVYGICKREQRSGYGENKMLFDSLLKVLCVEFEREDDAVNVAEHRDTFEGLAERSDAVDLFAESLAPQLHVTDAWDSAFEFAVAYLFGAPRIDIPRGPTYRGDLHFLIITDYAMGKSTVKEDIEAYSPQCISKSTTALASDVGLTAAAVQDDFGEGAWTLKPGLLVRASGGHLILDEIDKGPEELEKMNDALEGKQEVDIEKAGQSATYDSQTALLAMGNPKGGRFNPNEPVSAQIDVPESLLSRFDGIVTMQDTAQVQQDAAVAEAWGRSYIEAQEYQYGDREEFDYLSRPVPIDVGQAWVEYARKNVHPKLTREQFDELKTWYAEEVRQLNRGSRDVSDDMPVPATVRELAAAAKMAVAFARVHLREEVLPADIERAKKLGKRIVKQNWTGERFDATKNVTPKAQDDRITALKATIRGLSESGSTGTAAFEEIASRMNLAPEQLEHDLDNLCQKGEVSEPRHGEFRLV